MPVFLDVVRAFGKLKTLQASGPNVAIANSEQQPLNHTSDLTLSQASRVSPICLVQASDVDLDRQIEEKLQGDESLLQRVKVIFTSDDDKKNFLGNLSAVEELHRNGNIEFHKIKDPSSILRRLAFQFTFAGFSPPIDPPFKLNCLGCSQGLDPQATHGGACNRTEHLSYLVTILDNDENRFVLDSDKPILPREFAEDAEVAHVVQHYFKDLLGIKQENLIAPEQFVMFMEVPEHLKMLIYKSLQEPDFDLSQGLKLGELGGFFMTGHLAAQPVSTGIITKLLDWEKRGLIERKDFPQCIRAYTVIFSLVDPKEICTEGNNEIRQLFACLVSLLMVETGDHKITTQGDVETLLTMHSGVLRAKGLQGSDFDLIREVATNLSSNSGDMQEKALEFNKLGPVIAPFFEPQKQFTDRVVSSVLSIDDPKALFEMATNAVANNGYVPPKD